MKIVTTHTLEGYEIVEYKGVVFGEVINGIDFIKDIGASFRNLVGGRSKGYEEEIIQSRTDALRELESRAMSMGANAVVGLRIDYETLGGGGMIMVSCTGTAVVVNEKQ
ncbi:hypothetical protein AOC36_00715 [Erysipelothrix larvae]|uniref:UPF0145 protein AOC36_00715 n=1 Tax=Erysipelothrix larvae TaxID=1514105 RepID=A0A120JTD7_9FIRM|nr:YbjQ family protein [Erysipelothrix larvae]AMC92566.1 hypothetical protein AOC36_00715 [Erysipelothrix larvae]